MSEFRFLAAVIAIVAVALIESIIASRWRPWFFRSGIRVYQRNYRLGPLLAQPVDPLVVERTVRSRIWGRILVRQIGLVEYAFREPLFQLSLIAYTPIMHGYAVISPTTRTLAIEGRLYWSAVVFPLGMAVMFLSVGVSLSQFSWFVSLFVAVLVLTYMFIYQTQARRFSRVGEALKACSEAGVLG